MSHLYNIYWLVNGEQHRECNLGLAQVTYKTVLILDAGGEITGIINVKDDQ